MRTIVHLHADAFFAAVEQASDPKLRGKPVEQTSIDEDYFDLSARSVRRLANRDDIVTMVDYFDVDEGRKP